MVYRHDGREMSTLKPTGEDIHSKTDEDNQDISNEASTSQTKASAKTINVTSTKHETEIESASLSLTEEEEDKTKTEIKPDFQTLDVKALIQRNSSFTEASSSNRNKNSPEHGFSPGEVPAMATSTPLNTTVDVDGGAVESTSNEPNGNASPEENLERRVLELMRQQNSLSSLPSLTDFSELMMDVNNTTPPRNFNDPFNSDDDDDDDLFRMIADSMQFQSGQLPEPLYPMGPLTYKECIVCMEMKDLNLRTCCTEPICDDCVLMYVNVQIQQGNVKIGCPNDSCDKYVHRDEVMTRLSGEMKEKYHRFLIDANKDPHVKTCPRCSAITKVSPSQLKKPKVKKKGLRKTCTVCEIDWCFLCQAPWHEGITCKKFLKGDKLLKRWAKQQQSGQANAQKCPKCKIFIQRSSGCDHMVCTKCHVDFCYKCGERHIKIKFIGDHYSRLSIFGCKYRYLPNNPIRRKLVRGSIFAAKTVMLPVIAALAVGVGAVILGIGIFVFPVWCGIRLRNHLRQRKKRKEEMKYREMWRKKLSEIRIQGDPYIENYNRMRDLGQGGYPIYIGGIDDVHRSTSITSDDNSITSSNMEDNYIQLSPANLDIHATLEMQNSLDCNDDFLKVNKSKCESMSDISSIDVEYNCEKSIPCSGVTDQTHDDVSKRVHDNVAQSPKSVIVSNCDCDEKLQTLSPSKSQTLHLVDEEVQNGDNFSSSVHKIDETSYKTDVLKHKTDISKEKNDDVLLSNGDNDLLDKKCDTIESHDNMCVVEMDIVSKSDSSGEKTVTCDDIPNVHLPKRELSKTKNGNYIFKVKPVIKRDENKVKRLVSQYSCGLKSESDDDNSEIETEIKSSSMEICPKDLKDVSVGESLKLVNSSSVKVNSSKTKESSNKDNIGNNNAPKVKDFKDMDLEELKEHFTNFHSGGGVKKLVTQYSTTSLNSNYI